jgi:hypothetical protein
MSDPSMGHDQSNEPGLDAIKPPEGVMFAGLLGSSGEIRNTSNWYYDWRCEAWESRAASAPRAGRARGQGAFAWIAVPALVALIALSLSESFRPASSVAVPGEIAQAPHQLAVLPRLHGKWASADKGHLLCFVHVDPTSLSGTYVQFPEGSPPGQRVRFEVIHEDPKGDRLIIKQCSEDLKGGETGISDAAGALDVSIYIPLHGRSLTWIEIREGRPVMKVYERVDDSAATDSPAS